MMLNGSARCAVACSILTCTIGRWVEEIAKFVISVLNEPFGDWRIPQRKRSSLLERITTNEMLCRRGAHPRSARRPKLSGGGRQ